jgi:hypothetical protein
MLLSAKSEVVFDAYNKHHRNAYDQYLRNNRSWAKVNFRFRAPHFGITIGYIERRLLEYYTDKEFGKKHVSEAML